MTGAARRTVHDEIGLSPSQADFADVDPPVADRVARLTDVQCRCLELVLEHKSSKEIAQLLAMTQQSIDWHMKAAMQKLKADNRIAAALILRAYGTSETRQRLARQSPELVTVAAGADVESPSNRRSSHDASTTQLYDSEASTGVWLATEIRPDHAVHGGNTLGIGVSWGALNTLRIRQRLILIVLIGGFSALAFGAIVASLAALQTLF